MNVAKADQALMHQLKVLFLSRSPCLVRLYRAAILPLNPLNHQRKLSDELGRELILANWEKVE
jgi:hypothetical protein